MMLIFSLRLYGHIHLNKSLFVEHGVGDFHQIKHKGKRLDYKTFNQLHHNSLQFLNNSISESTKKKKVVATHHITTQQCNPAQYKGSNINLAFVSEQHHLIKEWNIDYWIYGHHHANMPVTNINWTKLDYKSVV